MVKGSLLLLRCCRCTMHQSPQHLNVGRARVRICGGRVMSRRHPHSLPVETLDRVLAYLRTRVSCVIQVYIYTPEYGMFYSNIYHSTCSNRSVRLTRCEPSLFGNVTPTTPTHTHRVFIFIPQECHNKKTEKKTKTSYYYYNVNNCKTTNGPSSPASNGSTHYGRQSRASLHRPKRK